MAASEPFICVEIIATKGSTPRDAGAKLWVSRTDVRGSIGGGHMEAASIAKARALLVSGDDNFEETVTLGPDTGQCCGGVVTLNYGLQAPPEGEKSVLAIFGAGHVGAYLSRLAKALDFEVHLYDERSKIEIEKPEPYLPMVLPERAIEQLPKHAKIIILTHDHGLDFLLAEAALARNFPFIGMIGSKSKAARFRSAHKELDFTNFHSPIGKHSDDKRPEAIALAILQELI